MKKFLLLLVCIYLLQPANLCLASNSFTDPLDGYFDVSRFLSENAYGFLPVPIVITDPALEGGLGVMGLIFHESEAQQAARLKAMQGSESAAAHLLPPNVSALALAITGNDSWFGGGGHMAFWKQGKVRYAVGLGYGDVNLDFYGFGDFQLQQPVTLNTKAYGLFQSIKFKLGGSKFFAGFAQRLVSAELGPESSDFLSDPRVPQPILDQLGDLLTQEVTTSGLGVVVEFDSRDNVFSPKVGYQYSLQYLRFDDAIGSDPEFNLLVFEGLNFWRLADSWRLGLKLYSENANADQFLPPYATPALIQRGIPVGRYQGNHVQATELELNYEINFRWEASIFAGAGRVANERDELSDARRLYNRGLGFRYHIARRYGLYMGMDFAKGPEENVWYIQAGSAW